MTKLQDHHRLVRLRDNLGYRSYDDKLIAWHTKALEGKKFKSPGEQWAYIARYEDKQPRPEPTKRESKSFGALCDDYRIDGFLVGRVGWIDSISTYIRGACCLVVSGSSVVGLAHSNKQSCKKHQFEIYD